MRFTIYTSHNTRAYGNKAEIDGEILDNHKYKEVAKLVLHKSLLTDGFTISEYSTGFAVIRASTREEALRKLDQFQADEADFTNAINQVARQGFHAND